MERSHAPLTHWGVAFTMGCSTKGFSAHQLHRQLGCQYKTAWFLHHRVMEAMGEVASLHSARIAPLCAAANPARVESGLS